MEHSLSWEADRSSASPEILSFLYIRKIPYRIRKSPPTASILSHIDSIQVLHPTSLGPILVLSSHLCLGLPSSLLPSVFPTKSCTHLSPKFATCATNLFHLVDNIRPLSNPLDIIDIVKVQSVRINDLLSFTFRHFYFCIRCTSQLNTWLLSYEITSLTDTEFFSFISKFFLELTW